MKSSKMFLCFEIQSWSVLQKFNFVMGLGLPPPTLYFFIQECKNKRSKIEKTKEKTGWCCLISFQKKKKGGQIKTSSLSY